jgi:hypothetical protein
MALFDKTALLLLVSTLLYSAVASTEELDVDQADSMDFEKFHQSKNQSIKAYDSKTGEIFGIKKEKAKKHSTADTSTLSAPTNSLAEAKTTIGQRLEIRQRYAVTISEHTTDTSYTAMDTLHKTMARHCPNGWEKQKEWSTAVEKDFYLHYAFQCRNK